MSDSHLNLPVLRTQPQTLVIPPAPPIVKGSAGQIITVNEVLFVLRRWWWRCLLLGIPLAAAAGAAVWLTFEPQYEALALLKIDPTTKGLGGTSRGPDSFAQTQLEIMKSNITLSEVAADPKIAAIAEIGSSSPLDWLRKNLRVNYVGQSLLCQIVFKCGDAQTAADVANAVKDKYLDIYRQQSGDEDLRLSNALEKECARRRTDLQAQKDKVRELRKLQTGFEPMFDRNGVDLASPSTQVASLEARQTSTEVDRILLNAKLEAYEEAIAAAVVTISPEELEDAIESDARVQFLKAELDKAQTKADLYAQAAPPGPRHQAVQTLMKRNSDDVGLAEAALKKAREELWPKFEKQMQAAARAQREGLLSKTQAEIDDKMIIENTLKERIKAERIKLGKVSGESQEMEFVRDKLRRDQDVYDKLMDQKTQLGLSQSPNPEIMHEALVPQSPIEAMPFKKTGMASFAAFLLPFGLAFGWEKLLRRIRSAEQLSSEVSLPVLGEVTTLPTRWMIPGRRTSERFLRDRATFEESIESLRLGLTLCPDFQDLQTVVVTSAISQEGKTSVATALALSVARCTQELTLLVDADMRAPNAHEMFGISLGPGLAEVLEGSAKLEDAIAAKGLSVHVLPAGVLKVSPHVAMKDGAFTRLLDELKTKYRYIIIDAPPVLAASEALLVASAADGALVCTMRDRSRMQQLNTACQRLVHSGARLVGAVISGVPTRDWAQKYGSYGYGYGYGWDRYSTANASWSTPASSEPEVVVESKPANE